MSSFHCLRVRYSIYFIVLPITFVANALLHDGEIHVAGSEMGRNGVLQVVWQIGRSSFAREVPHSILSVKNGYAGRVEADYADRQSSTFLAMEQGVVFPPGACFGPGLSP